MAQERGQSLNLKPASLSKGRQDISSAEKKANDLEWQIWFAKNHIFGSVERRKEDTHILIDFRDRAIAELRRLKPK